VFDIGTGENISLNQAKDIVLEYFPDTTFAYKGARPSEVAETRASPAKFKALGWNPQTSIADGVRKCFSDLKMEMG